LNKVAKTKVKTQIFYQKAAKKHFFLCSFTKY